MPWVRQKVSHYDDKCLRKKNIIDIKFGLNENYNEGFIDNFKIFSFAMNFPKISQWLKQKVIKQNILTNFSLWSSHRKYETIDGKTGESKALCNRIILYKVNFGEKWVLGLFFL